MTTTSNTAVPDAAPAPPSGRRSVPRGVWVVTVVLVVAALVCAGVFGTLWAVAALGSGGGSVADQRDAALSDAQQDAVNLTTIDSSDVDGTLASWNSVVTGDLATQFSSSRSQLEQQISANPGRTTSQVASAALSALDAQAGTATAVVFVDVTTTTDSEQPQQRRFALSMAVQRTDSGWKASGLQSLAQDAGQ